MFKSIYDSVIKVCRQAKNQTKSRKKPQWVIDSEKEMERLERRRLLEEQIREDERRKIERGIGCPG